jgi:hypothetical protein
MAGLTLQHVSDLPALPAAESILAVSALEGVDWARIRLSGSHLNDLEPLLSKGNARVD